MSRKTCKVMCHVLRIKVDIRQLDLISWAKCGVFCDFIRLQLWRIDIRLFIKIHELQHNICPLKSTRWTSCCGIWRWLPWQHECCANSPAAGMWLIQTPTTHHWWCMFWWKKCVPSRQNRIFNKPQATAFVEIIVSSSFTVNCRVTLYHIIYMTFEVVAHVFGRQPLVFWVFKMEIMYNGHEAPVTNLVPFLISQFVHERLVLDQIQFIKSSAVLYESLCHVGSFHIDNESEIRA